MATCNTDLVRDWVRLGETMRERREALNLTQQQASEAAGVSLAVWSVLERGRNDNPKRKSLRGVDTALGWGHGSAEAIADGGEPTLAGPAPTAGAVRHTRRMEVPGNHAGGRRQSDPMVNLLREMSAAMTEMQRLLAESDLWRQDVLEQQQRILDELRQLRQRNAPGQ